MSSHKHIVLLLVTGLCLFLGGCATKPVTPWQRSAFAGYGMSPDRDALAKAANEHVYTSREAASGGSGVGGSGCGCR